MKTITKMEDGSYVVTDDRTLHEAKESCIYMCRKQVSVVLSDAGIDTATQQNAALGIYEPARCEAIKNYIAACRNEYLRCKGLILAATSNDEADAVQFIPPTIPEGL